MKKYDNIIMSTTEPGRNDIWLKDNKLYAYIDGKWVAVSGGGRSVDLSSLTQEQEDIIHEVAQGEYDMSDDFNNDFSN